jgi:hypothetical protein
MEKHQSDMPAAFTGLLVGAVFVLAVVFSIVKIVNATHAGKAEAPHTTQA